MKRIDRVTVDEQTITITGPEGDTLVMLRRDVPPEIRVLVTALLELIQEHQESDHDPSVA